MKNKILGFLIENYVKARSDDDLVCYICMVLRTCRFITARRKDADVPVYFFEYSQGTSEIKTKEAGTKTEAIINLLNVLK